MSSMKRVKDLQVNDLFKYQSRTYRVHATFMKGVANTELSVTITDPYERMPRYLTLPNTTVVETMN